MASLKESNAIQGQVESNQKMREKFMAQMEAHQKSTVRFMVEITEDKSSLLVSIVGERSSSKHGASSEHQVVESIEQGEDQSKFKKVEIPIFTYYKKMIVAVISFVGVALA